VDHERLTVTVEAGILLSQLNQQLYDNGLALSVSVELTLALHTDAYLSTTLRSIGSLCITSRGAIPSSLIPGTHSIGPRLLGLLAYKLLKTDAHKTTSFLEQPNKVKPFWILMKHEMTAGSGMSWTVDHMQLTCT